MGEKQKEKKALKIPEKNQDPMLNIVLDTLALKKQALVFVNSKPSAESAAERIAHLIKKSDFLAYGIEEVKTADLKDGILSAVSPSTRQCKRESLCIEKGIAFHHAGLHPKQKEIIEDGFRIGEIKVICATPTLAFGLDLPAFRAIIRDVKRYGKRGMGYIPVLEYEQQAGRAGRPGMEDYGEAILVAETEQQKEELVEIYLKGTPEEIYSKLAVEPVLRTYVLSLVASRFTKTRKTLEDFFDMTFYAHQFGDLDRLHRIMRKIIKQLRQWKFLKGKGEESGNADIEDDFVSADELEKGDEPLEATLLGKRVSELYLDPYTAHQLIEQMHEASTREKIPAEGILFMISRCLEMRPLPRVKVSEMDIVQGWLNTNEGKLFEKEPEMFDDEYEDFVSAAKQSLIFEEWISEKTEEYILETYGIRPGEMKQKLDNADWLLYSIVEMSKLLSQHAMEKEAVKLRVRFTYGAREELLPLLKLKNIGRIRARQLYQNKIKDLGDAKKEDILVLIRLLGKSLAVDVKQQVGEEVPKALLDELAEKGKDKEKALKKQRKGQMQLGNY